MIKLAVNNIKNWIYVTGMGRSGTTFVGKVLSLPLQVDYIHEPFNPTCGLPGMNHWDRYIRPSLDTEEMQQFNQLVRSIFTYDFKLKTHLPKSDPFTDKLLKRLVGSRGPFYLRIAKLNPFHEAAVIKAPIGLLLTEYMYIHFKVKPVIVIKHPVSIIASLKRVNWWPNLKQFNDQIHLQQDYFADEPQFFYGEWSDPVLAIAAYWRAVHKVLLAQNRKYPTWQIILHEQLSQQPAELFHHIYDELNLPWSESIATRIFNLTQGNHSANARKGKVQDFNRNSAEIFKARRQSLSLEERKAIFEIVEDVALQIYSRESFDID